MYLLKRSTNSVLELTLHRFLGLQQVVSSLLSSATAGYNVWGSDIGALGHVDDAKKNDPELYARWLQLATFSPLMRAHGQTSWRDPWAYSDSSVDLFQEYYDTRPSTFNGVFDFYTAKPLKGYYAFYWYGMFYDMKAEVRAINEIENIYSLCGVDENGKVLAIVTHYSDNDEVESKSISVDFGKEGEYEIYLLDAEHNGELVQTTEKLEFDMKLHSAILIKEK